MADAAAIMVPIRRENSAAVAAGASSIPNTSSVPTVRKETTTVSAMSASIKPWKSREGNPEASACSGSKERSRKGRRQIHATEAITTVAASCSPISRLVTPRISPKRIRTRSPAKAPDRETMATPRASIPTNRSPMAVSPESFERRVMTPIPRIMAAAPAAAPTIPGRPSSMATATPGRTPWARASPMKARPRRTTNVPTIPQAIETRIPAARA